MFRFVRIFGKQYLGFWLPGLILFAVQEIPYMIMPMLKLRANPIMDMEESSVLLDCLEKFLGSACIALMILTVHEDAGWFSVTGRNEKIFFCMAAAVLLLNFAGWGLYFSGHQSIFVMMFFIVVMPPLYYVSIGLWRNNPMLTVTGCVFLIVHFCHVLGNLTMKHS